MLKSHLTAPEHLRETLNNLPTRPGCYLMHDLSSQVIYVGKAINLRARVRSYFHASAQEGSIKTARLVAEIDRIEFIVTDSELEALILEANLILPRGILFSTCCEDPPDLRVSNRL